MMRLLRILGWVLLAPLVWVLGELLICICSPVVYEIEHIPVEGIPARELTVDEVAKLNRALETDREYLFNLTYVSLLVEYEHWHAVPVPGGRLELVHVYPSLCWGEGRSRADVDEAVQRWLSEINQKGGNQPCAE